MCLPSTILPFISASVIFPSSAGTFSHICSCHHRPIFMCLSMPLPGTSSQISSCSHQHIFTYSFIPSSPFDHISLHALTWHILAYHTFLRALT
jgi:hypothetical protein